MKQKFRIVLDLETDGVESIKKEDLTKWITLELSPLGQVAQLSIQETTQETVQNAAKRGFEGS